MEMGEMVYRELVHQMAAMRRPTFSLDIKSPNAAKNNHDGLEPCAIYLDRGSLHQLIAYDFKVVHRNLYRDHEGNWKFQNVPTFQVVSAVQHIKVYGERPT